MDNTGTAKKTRRSFNERALAAYKEKRQTAVETIEQLQAQIAGYDAAIAAIEKIDAVFAQPAADK